MRNGNDNRHPDTIAGPCGVCHYVHTARRQYTRPRCLQCHDVFIASHKIFWFDHLAKNGQQPVGWPPTPEKAGEQSAKRQRQTIVILLTRRVSCLPIFQSPVSSVPSARFPVLQFPYFLSSNSHCPVFNSPPFHIFQ